MPEIGIFIITLYSDIPESTNQKLAISHLLINTEISETKLSLTLWTLLLATKLLDHYSLRYPQRVDL